MSDAIWRECQHCKKPKYCSTQAMLDHEEDCDQRPSKRKNMLLCPKCQSVLTKMKSDSDEAWLCVNENCDFEVGVLKGGKLT